MSVDGFGFDVNGNPIDYRESLNKREILWVYQGKSENGADNWYGCY
ncbi:MAG: hypothetical protein IKH25_11495 [Muribaculaceae bacterium]|nr:hypothetical protein [Muribaculaceae bacterium]